MLNYNITLLYCICIEFWFNAPNVNVHVCTGKDVVSQPTSSMMMNLRANEYGRIISNIKIISYLFVCLFLQPRLSNDIFDAEMNSSSDDDGEQRHNAGNCRLYISLSLFKVPFFLFNILCYTGWTV